VQLVLDANGLPTGTFTLQAVGGPVTYTMAVPAPLTVVSVSAPALTPSVTLPAGKTVTVTLGVAAGTTLTQAAILTVTPTTGPVISVMVNPVQLPT
jgi:hypothetical protein